MNLYELLYGEYFMEKYEIVLELEENGYNVEESTEYYIIVTDDEEEEYTIYLEYSGYDVHVKDIA